MNELRRLAELQKAIGESSGVIAALRNGDFDATVAETDFAALAEKWEAMERSRNEARQGLGESDTRPHDEVPDNCPTYFNGCHCTVEVLTHNIARAQKAEAQLAAANAEIARLRAEVGEKEKALEQHRTFYRRNPPPDLFVANEQIIEDAVGLTIQFEVAPDGERILRFFGDAIPCGNRQLNFNKSGQHVGSGTTTQGLCKPGWLTKIDDPESEAPDA